MTFHFLTET